MPKLRKTEEQKRNAATLAAITRGIAENGFRNQEDVARHFGMSPQNYSSYKKNSFRNMNLDLFSEVARGLELTDIELCAIVGIPYRGYRQ